MAALANRVRIPYPGGGICAVILLMETKPLAEVRQDLSRYVDEAVKTHARFDITRNGKRAAVLLSADDYDSLLETLDVLSAPDLVANVQAAITEVAAGETVTHEQVVADLTARRAAHS